MIEFINADGRGRKMRLWMNDMPEHAFIGEGVERVEQTFPRAVGYPVRTKVAVELFHPFGAMFQYGLLGAELLPDSSGILSMSIPNGSGEPKGRYAEALAGSLDDVVVGFNPEYTSAIVDGVQQVSGKLMPSGRIAFCYMACGAASSSPFVFQTLARTIIRLLTLSEEPRTAKEAVMLLSE